VYYILPVVNPDGVALIEEQFNKHPEQKTMKKRKNMSPNAVYSQQQKYNCSDEDSGVDLNRNYGVDWGIGVLTQVGIVDDYNIADNGEISMA
tara:strand:+ start:103 stop:378 length:276 start_codon:yes stop_codon:yes gene_type:complete